MKQFYALTVLFASSILLFSFQSHAQRTCSSESYMEQLLSDPDFADAYRARQEAFKQFAATSDRSALCADPVVLPIAIHFQGISSPDQACLVALAQNQVQILNDDYQGLNADIANWNNTSSSFFPGTSNGETCMEFCLATYNHPTGYGLSEGQPAVTINQTSGDFDSNWSGYINVFVRDIGALGYSPLGGSGNGDGVVVDVEAFGSGSGCSGVVPGSPYDLGRTLTHEMGHFLNLGHIWGGGCGSDDGVGDTPDSDSPYYGCPSNGSASCGSTDMHMSYMDYTDDACMYMFSAGQSTRMENYVASNFSSVINNASTTCGPPPPAHCSNGVQDADETGVDCGGADCPACPEPCLGTELTLDIVLDNYPQETTWVIQDGSGSTVASGGAYGSFPDGSAVQEIICIEDGCYDFIIYDSFGDGICCDFGNGSYQLSDPEGAVLASGGAFASSETTPFCVTSTSDPCEVFASAPVDLTKSQQPVPYPNGVIDRVQLKFYKASPEVKYTAADDAMLDIEFWPIRDLATNTPITDGPVSQVYDKVKPGQNFFKWPLKFNRADIQPNTRYRWRVRVKCQQDPFTMSPWSEEKVFNTPDFDPETGIYTPSGAVIGSGGELKRLTSDDIQLSPNPAQEQLTISSPTVSLTGAQWQITDMMGRMIAQGRFTGLKGERTELDVHMLAPGTYQIQIVGSQYLGVDRFMIRR